MCRLLNVSRTGYCQWQTRTPSDRALANAILDAQVAALHRGSKRRYALLFSGHRFLEDGSVVNGWRDLMRPLELVWEQVFQAPVRSS